MKIQLSDHFDLKRLVRFVIPSVVMMMFTSIYSVVDGFFVSNFVGKTPFAALNLIYPFIQILGAIGFMLGTGGSALVANLMGEGKREKANKVFSMLIYVGITAGIILAVVGIIFTRPIAVLLGADGDTLEYCVIYARVILCALPAFLLQNMFQSFLVTAEKPTLGLIVTVLAGVTNMILDALLTAVIKGGIFGAALATAMSQLVGGLIPFIYFMRGNNGTLRLVKAGIDKKQLLLATTNGSSEFVTNISVSVIAMLYNFQLMKYAGENGVAAYGVVMYISYVFIAIYLGYSIGVAPIIGYNQGAENDKELKNIVGKSLKFVGCAGVTLTILAFVLSKFLSGIFVGYDAELMEMTTHAIKIYAFSFFLCGFSIFGSALFTALNNGVISALVSFIRTMVFQLLAVLIMPVIWGIEGVWYSIIVAEAAAMIMSLSLIFAFRKKYRYF